MQTQAKGGAESGEIVSAGDAAFLIRFGTDVSERTHARVVAFLRAMDRRWPSGLRDMVPAYASVLAIFDPLLADRAALEADVRAVLARLRPRRVAAGRLVCIPVAYGGADGPDLEEVARLVGLSPEEVARRHAEAEYRVYFLGFLAGFPYLGGLPPDLVVPRLPIPRARVPEGSVALAGQQTGIYPVSAPGGWRIIGRTTAHLFDPMRDPPALLQPGDRVRFYRIREVPGAAGPGSHIIDSGSIVTRTSRTRTSKDDAEKATVMPAESIPWVSICSSGPLATVQDLGRLGFARYGVSSSGAADAEALQLGNLLLGNPSGLAAIELTFGGGEFSILSPCLVAVTGAPCTLRHNGRLIASEVVTALESGDMLEVGAAQRGVRTYLCVAGGVRTATVLGSSSTDLRAGLGGLGGRPLRADDVLWRGQHEQQLNVYAGRVLPAAPVCRYADARPPTIRIAAGPHAEASRHDLDVLLSGTFVIDARSDRVGVRLVQEDLGHTHRPIGGETISEGMPRGAIQVPPGGGPIILLADHQTTGGYRVPAVVTSVDLWRVAQLRPGETLRFSLVTAVEAVAALRARVAWLERLGAGVGYEALDAAVLMRGFAEWSEEESDEN